MEMLRLLFLADGESVHTKRFLSYFVNKGYDIHLITSTAKPIKGVKIHELRFSLARNSGLFAYVSFPLRVLSILKTIKKINPDILHAHYIINYGLCGVLSGFHPFVLSVLGSDLTRSYKIKKLVAKYVIACSDVVDGFVLRERLIKLGCSSKKIFPYSWGVDIDTFSPRIRQNNPQKNGYSVICARFWKPMYSVETFIKAIPLVQKTMKNVKFVLVGGGLSENNLQELARKLGVYDDIEWVGFVSEEDMPKYLANADICVDTFPRYVGIGQTTRQAMSCGTPSIITKSVDNFDAKIEFNCLTYRPRDYRDLAGKIVFLLSNENFRRKLGEESREYALEFFDENKNMKLMENVYHNLVK
ncbi:MAG: glycosyltransferase family 4 protein [Candidatus Bathyarchaeia archaeon]|jgi:glycosyltransferase involved in cell wall biosynthesis